MRPSPVLCYPGPERGVGRRISCSLSGWLRHGWLTVAMCPLSVGEACRRHAGASGTHPWVACSPRYAVDLDTGGPFAARRLGSEAVETSQQVTPGLCITNALRGHASPVRGLEIPSGWADLVLAFACCSWVSGRTGCGSGSQGEEADVRVLSSLFSL